MLHNHLTVSVRRLLRRPGTTAIHVVGLALGLACSLLIGLFIRDELSYDRFWPDSDRIYRVTTELVDEAGGGQTEVLASTFEPVAGVASASIAGIEGVTRLNGNSLNRTLVTVGDVGFYQDGLFAADAGVFDVFGIRLERGDPATALERPHTVVLSETQARRYFGDADPLGMAMSIRSEEYEVTGVMPDLPDNTHLTFSILTSIATAEATGRYAYGWNLLGFHTYLRLAPGTDPARVAQGIGALSAPLDGQAPSVFRLQPVTDIHLRSHLEGEIQANGDIRYVWLFGSVALLVLLIACVNYMNLASAIASRRASEVGLRKVVGADRSQIVSQFLSESVLVGVMALVVAVLLIEIALPWFNALTRKSLSLDYLREGGLIALVAIGAGLLSGSYPAMILARFRPARALSAPGGSTGRGMLRRALVVFQFTVSIALITSTVVVQRQLDYVQEERIGFDKERLVTLHSTQRLAENYPAFKQQLLADARVMSVTMSTNVPGNRVFNEYGMRPDSGDARFYLTYSNVDFDFVGTMGVGLVAGRDLSPTFGTDLEHAILVNETAVRRMGWSDGVGKTLFGRTVVGVVRDYLTSSSREEVKAGAFVPSESVDRFVVVRLAPGTTTAAVGLLADTWATFVPEAPADISFLDADIDAMYRSEQRLGRVFIAFSLLAVVIACLGLFGLAAFAAEQRTKEIGIRKVLGATVGGIVGLLSREFVALVAVSLIVGGPLAWFLMNRWLQDYVYRVSLEVWIPIVAGIVALVVALATVAWHAVRAATADPVRSLRYE